MSELKYIIVQAKAANDKVVEFPVIFGHYVSHKDMAEHVRSMLWRGQFRLSAPKVVSAGFVNMADAKVHGHSESLDMASRHEDEAIINAFRMDWSLA